MDSKKRFKAQIAGKDYTIVGSLSATHLNTVVDLVNQQIEQLTELAPELSNADRCVLMAVNAVSDQLVKEKKIIELEAELAKLKGKPIPEKYKNHTNRRPTINGRSTSGIIADKTNFNNSLEPQAKSNLINEAKAGNPEFPFKRK